MSYAAVITHVQADEMAAPRLRCAVETAARFGADLIGVAAEMVPPLLFNDGIYPMEADWTIAMRETIEGRLKSACDAFDKATDTLGHRARRLSGLRLPSPAMAAASRAADLIVAGGASRRMHDAYRDCSSAELALTAGRPVLVAPPNPAPLDAKRILLAWKDTREARRALSDSLPFLEKADQVVITSVCPQSEADDAKLQVEDVAAALNRRGVKAEAHVAVHAHPDGFQILREAIRMGADLVVLGAYGHSRLGEWVFGGVTADLLAQDEVYLLLSH